MLVRFLKFCCLIILLAAQSLAGSDCIAFEGEEFPPPRSKPEEIPVIYKCYEPRLCHFVIPAGIAAVGLTVGAIKATECPDDCDPGTEVQSVSTLEFFVEASLGGDIDGVDLGGSITLEIEFPDMSLLDTISFSVPPVEDPVMETELSNSTTDFESGDQFVVNVTAEAERVEDLVVTMRIDGVDIIAQPDSSPTIATSFTFTIP